MTKVISFTCDASNCDKTEISDKLPAGWVKYRSTVNVTGANGMRVATPSQSKRYDLCPDCYRCAQTSTPDRWGKEPRRIEQPRRRAIEAAE